MGFFPGSWLREEAKRAKRLKRLNRLNRKPEELAGSLQVRLTPMACEVPAGENRREVGNPSDRSTWVCHFWFEPPFGWLQRETKRAAPSLKGGPPPSKHTQFQNIHFLSELLSKSGSPNGCEHAPKMRVVLLVSLCHQKRGHQLRKRGRTQIWEGMCSSLRLGCLGSPAILTFGELNSEASTKPTKTQLKGQVDPDGHQKYDAIQMEMDLEST